MRAVKAAQNLALKQQLSEVNPKFRAGANELEKESELKILQPTNAEQLKQLTALVESLRRQNQHDPAWQNALRLWQSQIATGALSDQVKFEFVRRFYFWLLGRGTTDDVKRTSWGRANVAVLNREVSLYIEQFSQRRLDYALQLSLLALRVPSTLNGYFLYFKYIVNGKLKRAKDHAGGEWWELSDDDYLQDFEMFQQEFDGNTGKGDYKDVIKPAAQRSPNQPPFDASRPFPADLQQNAQHRHHAKTNEQIIAAVTAQENENPAAPLPKATGTDENGMAEKPVQVPKPDAPAVSSNLPAMGIQPSDVAQIVGEATSAPQAETREAETRRHSAHLESVTKLLQEARAGVELSAKEQSRLNSHLSQALEPIHHRLSNIERTTGEELGKHQAVTADMFKLMQGHIERFPAMQSNLLVAHEAQLANTRANTAREFAETLKGPLAQILEALQQPSRPIITEMPNVNRKWQPENMEREAAKALTGAAPEVAAPVVQLAPEAVNVLKDVSAALKGSAEALTADKQRELQHKEKQIQTLAQEALEATERARQAKLSEEQSRMREQQLRIELERAQTAQRSLVQEGRGVIQGLLTEGGQLLNEAKQIVQQKERAANQAEATTHRVVEAARSAVQKSHSEAEAAKREAKEYREQLAAAQAALESFTKKNTLRLEQRQNSEQALALRKEEEEAARTADKAAWRAEQEAQVPPKQKEEADEPEPPTNKRSREEPPAEKEPAAERKAPKKETANSAGEVELREEALRSYNKLYKKMDARAKKMYGIDLVPPNATWTTEKARTEFDALMKLVQDIFVRGPGVAAVQAKYGKKMEWRKKL